MRYFAIFFEPSTTWLHASAEQVESSNALAAILFAKAEVALEADGVEETEYDRLVDFYVEDAFAQVINETEETRYTAEECLAIAAEE